MPEVLSVPLNTMFTAWLYQPLWSAARSGTPELTVGGVASRLIVSPVASVVSPAPLVHEETLLFATEATEAAVEDEAVYSDIEPQIPLVTDYELLNTLNSMDKTRMDDLKESMVNETGGSK